VVQLPTNVFWAKIHSFLNFLKLPQECQFLQAKYRPRLSTKHKHTLIPFNILVPSPLLPACWHTQICLAPSIPSISKHPIQNKSHNLSVSTCRMVSILLSSSHFRFHTFKPNILPPFCKNNIKNFHRIPSQAQVCVVPGVTRDKLCVLSARVMK